VAPANSSGNFLVWVVGKTAGKSTKKTDKRVLPEDEDRDIADLIVLN
jgi:hypothetical protein